KAFCSPTIEVTPLPDTDELGWWQSFWPDAMAEFFYRNGINFTDPDFLEIVASSDHYETSAPVAHEAHSEAAATALEAVPLVMFSGGKASLALTLSDGGRSQIDCFLYNPTSEQYRLAESVVAGGRLPCRAAHPPRTSGAERKGSPKWSHPYSAYLG